MVAWFCNQSECGAGLHLEHHRRDRFFQNRTIGTGCWDSGGYQVELMKWSLACGILYPSDQLTIIPSHVVQLPCWCLSFVLLPCWCLNFVLLCIHPADSNTTSSITFLLAVDHLFVVSPSMFSLIEFCQQFLMFELANGLLRHWHSFWLPQIQKQPNLLQSVTQSDWSEWQLLGVLLKQAGTWKALR